MFRAVGMGTCQSIHQTKIKAARESCVFIQAFVCFINYSSFDPRVRIMCHCSNPFEELLYVNSSLGFLRFPVVNVKNIKSYIGGCCFVFLNGFFGMCGDLR